MGPGLGSGGQLVPVGLEPLWQRFCQYHELCLQQTSQVASIPSLVPSSVCCHSPAQNCCSVTGALQGVLAAPHCARLMKNTLLTGLITECFLPQHLLAQGSQAIEPTKGCLASEGEGSPQRNTKAVKYSPPSTELASRWPVLSGFGCVLRPQPRILSLFSQSDHVIFISALCSQGSLPEGSDLGIYKSTSKAPTCLPLVP